MCRFIGALFATVLWTTTDTKVEFVATVANAEQTSGAVPIVQSPPPIAEAFACCEAGPTSTAPFVPISQRPDYCVEPPDILAVSATELDPVPSPAEGQPIRGEHRVEPDGTIDLGTWGKLHVAGKTTAQVKQAVAELIDAETKRYAVDVSVAVCNSKAFYVFDETLQGNSVSRFPANGNETVLDALARTGPMRELVKKKIFVSRPTLDGVDKILKVDWHVTGPDTLAGNNPTLLPGDRVFITEPSSWMALLQCAAALARERAAQNEIPHTAAK